MTAYAPIEHRHDCADHDNVRQFTGSRGDRLAQCQTCTRVAVITRAADLIGATATTEEQLAKIPLRGNRPHPHGWPTHRARARIRRHERDRRRAAG